MCMRTPWPQIKSLLGSVHRGIWFSFWDFPSWKDWDSVTAPRVSSRLAFGEVASSPAGGLHFVLPTPVLVTTAKVMASDPKEGRFGVGRRGKIKSPVLACMVTKENRRTSTGILFETSPTLVQTPFLYMNFYWIWNSQFMGSFPERGNWIQINNTT